MSKFRFEIIIGSMFSGKSTELLRRISCWEAIGKKSLLINHHFDTRTTNFVKTHNNTKKKAVKTNNLMNLLTLESFKKADVIGIDEAQFFNDLRKFIVTVEQMPKTIIISGLDGDYQRKPMGEILECIPLCDKVDKLTGLDMMSKDGSVGLFTKRIVNSSKDILIGDKDTYMSVNRVNYFKNINESNDNSIN